MELQNSMKDENFQGLEATVVADDKDARKNGEVEAEAKTIENEDVQTSAGAISKEDANVVETSVDANPEEAALVEQNKTEYETLKDPSVVATSSGMKKLATTRIVRKVKKLVRKKVLKGTALQVASEENAPLEEDITAVIINKDEQTAKPSLGETKKVIDSVADYPQCSSGKDKDSETSVGEHDKKEQENTPFAEVPQHDDEIVARAEPSGKETLEGVQVESSTLKGALSQEMDKKSANILRGHKEGVEMDSVVSGGNVMEADKAIEGAIEFPKNAMSVEKKQPRRLRGKAKLKKAPLALLVKTQVDKGTPELGQNNQEDNSLAVNEQQNGVEKEVNASEAGQQKTFAKNQKQNQLNGLTENKRRRKKRQGKQVLGTNKKQRKEVVAGADATQQRMEERQEQIVGPEIRKIDGHGKAKIGGLIFMCNAKTKPDCFRFSIMGVQEKRKDYVMGIKPGLKLFLYDYDLKLLYGIFQASSAGGMKLERNAFGGSFPAQVRFKVVKDCIPLPESQFKKAIKENYNNRNKFKTELTPKQVFKLKKLFRPAAVPAQVTHTLPVAVPRDADRNRSNKDRYAPSSSRIHPTRRHERSRNSPPPHREEAPHDLYLSEREYRTYGLRRAETSQHYQIPSPDSSYRDRVPLESYRPSMDHDRLLRHPEMERHDHREVRLLHLPERDYHMYDHLSSRRARDSLDSPASAVALDSYRRDPQYRYEYLASERPPRTYLASPRREDDDLYSRYVTADSLAEYYRSSRRYPNVAEPELLPSSVTSRYPYLGSLPYSHR